MGTKQRWRKDKIEQHDTHSEVNPTILTENLQTDGDKN